MNCMYCGNLGTARVPGDEQSCVCDKCWKLLQNPVTALPLIRGHLTITLRGKIPPDKLDEMIQKFMGSIASWQKKNLV